MHGSFSQEKALVTGYEAANLTLKHLGYGEDAMHDIIPLEEDEVHIKVARRAKKSVDRFVKAVNPVADFFMI